MTEPIVDRVLRSARYRDVDRGLVERLAGEEAAKAGGTDDAVKRVKRRLHQAVGAYRGASDVERLLAPMRASWTGDLGDAAFREACRAALARHASTAERLPWVEGFFAPVWAISGGAPRTVVDLGCGLGPLSRPWMGLPPDAVYHAVDVDRRSLAIVDAFFSLVGQAGSVTERDLAAGAPPRVAADVALLLKLAPLLDRQDAAAAARLIGGLEARHAVVSFPARSLGGRRRGMETTYRGRISELATELGVEVAGEASVPNELVFVLALRG